MLLAPAWKRLLVAGAAVALLWAAVLAVSPSTPLTGPAQPAARLAARETAERPSEEGTGPLRAVVRSGMAAPDGGSFDRFHVVAQPVLAPVNAHGQVAFYATVLHARAREGVFLAGPDGITKVAAYGDAAPGGGTFADFSAQPLPALNAAGHVAFTAQIAGGRATQGLFLADENGSRAVALTGEDAPGVPAATLVGFSVPALNDNDEIAVVATVRRGAETLDVLYFWNGRRLQRVVAERELLTRIGGTMDAIGEPALNNQGVIAFPAAIFRGPAVGGIFVAGARPLQLLVQAGEQTQDGAMILRFSEHVAIDDAGGVAFGAFLASGGNSQTGDQRAAVLHAGTEGLATLALEGAAAPGGGRYAGFGPWPTVGADGAVSFIAALDDGPAPYAVFSGPPGAVARVATAGEALAAGGRIGLLAPNAIAATAAGGIVAFPTIADRPGGRDAVFCRCAAP